MTAEFPWADRPVGTINANEIFAGRLSERFRIHRYPAEVDPAAEVLVVQFASVTKEIFDKYPNLRLLASTAAGYDAFDIETMRQRGIMLSTRQAIPDPCVVDLAMGLLIAAVRRIPAAERFVRAGTWPGNRFTQTRRVSGRRMGIFGMGRIGRDIARRAVAFDMEIGYHNRRALPDTPYRYFSDLKEMAEWCDYLMIACPLSDETFHKVDRQVLAALGPKGYVVNIGRGAIIDEAALVEALVDGTIAGAGLDVLEFEPQVPQAFLTLDNIALTPHIGGVTTDNHRGAFGTVIDNVESYFKTGKPLISIDLSSA